MGTVGSCIVGLQLLGGEESVVLCVAFEEVLDAELGRLRIGLLGRRGRGRVGFLPGRHFCFLASHCVDLEVFVPVVVFFCFLFFMHNHAAENIDQTVSPYNAVPKRCVTEEG